jgi:hypothetical protein
VRPAHHPGGLLQRRLRDSGGVRGARQSDPHLCQCHCHTDLIPSIAYGYDLQGWSYDAVFNEGRQFAILNLRAEYQKRFAAEIAYVPTWGGTYNNGRDRDVVTLAVSAKF